MSYLFEQRRHDMSRRLWETLMRNGAANICLAYHTMIEGIADMRRGRPDDREAHDAVQQKEPFRQGGCPGRSTGGVLLSIALVIAGSQRQALS
jgi:hypothetical protein